MPFTVEEFKELISDEKNKVTVNTILTAAGYETPEGIEGLVKKRDELLRQNVKLKEEKENIKKMFDGVDPEEYRALKAAGKAGGDLEKQYSGLEAKYKDLEGQSNLTKSHLHSVLKEAALQAALKANKFATHAQMMTDALVHKVVIDEERLSKLQRPTIAQAIELVNIPDSYGVPVQINKYLESYAGTESGKMYLDRPTNSSAGTQQLDGGGSGKNISRADYDNLPPEKQFKFTEDGGKITD